MEQELTNLDKPQFTVTPEPPEKKQVQFVKTLGEVFKVFDELDEDQENKFGFILQGTPEIKLPLISQEDVSNYLLKNALLLVDAGEFGLARNVLGDLLRRDSYNVEAIRWMGWCFKNDGDLHNALKCYEQLTQRRITDQDLFELGEIYYSLKRDTEALNTWLDALGQCHAESPHLFDLHKNLGNVYMRLGDFESAEENYNKALVIRPQSDVLQVNLGSLHIQLKNNGSAMEYFKKAIELNFYNDRAWCGLALIAREKNDGEWANAVLMKALDINAYNLTALQILVSWSQSDLTYGSAISRIQKYLEKYYDDLDMSYSLAGLFYQNGNLNEAEIELMKLEALQPDREGIEELRQLIKYKREAVPNA